MAGRPSNRDGAGDDKAYPPDSGLDAKLDRAVPTGDAEAFLLGVGGDHGGRVYPLSHNTVFIGRSELADVHIADPSVSGQHARIINGSMGFEIEDLGSTNGTSVEGQRVTRARLRSGDRIIVGQIEFKFLVDRRVDATMTIIPAGLPTSARREGALVLYQPPVQRSYAEPSPAPFAPTKRDRDEDEGLSLEEMIGRLALAYRFLQRNFRLIAFFASIGVFVGLVSVVLLPSPGETVCVLKLQPEVKTNPVDAQWGRAASEDQEIRFFANADSAFVQPELISETLRTILGHAPSDATVSSYAERLRMEPGLNNTYRASYHEKLIGASPPSGPQFLKTHLETYLHAEITRAIRVFSAQVDFLRDQLKTVEAEMKRISDEKMQFSQKNSDRLPEEAGQMLGSRFDLETRRAELTAQVRKLQGELDAQRRALAAEGPLAQNKLHESQVYRQSLAETNRKLSEAYARGLAEGHPEVIQLKDEKRRLEAFIQKEMGSETTAMDRQSNAGYQDIQNRVGLLQGQLSAARSDLADTERNLSHLQGVVGDLPRVQAGVQQLTHIQQATTQLHGQLFEQLKKAELQLNLERVSAESRYEVVVPVRLMKAGSVKTAAIRAGAGLFLGLFLAFGTLGARKIRELLARALFNLDAGSSPSGR
jgi:pSer/pThr/pTyr-binding forkhead associated (FHA) protein